MALISGAAAQLGTPTVLTGQQASGLTSMPWKLTAIDNKRSTIELVYITGDGDCVSPRGIYLNQTPTTVLVEVLSKTSHPGGSCANALTSGRGVVHLNGPLGGRTLIHAKVSRAWRTRNFFVGITA